MRILLLLAALCVGCGDDGAMTMPDLAVTPPDLAMDLAVPADLTPLSSSCGMPGDTGNANGIGKFCVVQGDCTGGTICTHAFSADDYFCTAACTAGSNTICGTGASCQCTGQGCGCVPDACVGMPQG
jgi:hypothetical protein